MKTVITVMVKLNELFRIKGQPFIVQNVRSK